MNEMKFWRAVFSILGLGVALYFFFLVASVMVPFLLGLVAAYMVHPLVERMVSIGMRRDRTVLVLYVGLLAVVVAVGFLLVPSLVHEANVSLQSLPAYAAKFNTLNDTITAELNKIVMRVAGKRAHAVALPFHADALVEKFVTTLPENISSVAHAGLWIVIIPFVCYFALAQGKEWMNGLFNITPSAYVENLLGLIAEVNATLGGYIRGQLLDAMCIGLMTMTGLWILGFEQAVLMGVLCGFLNPVPFLAPLIGGSLTLLIAYFQGMPMSALFGILCLFVLIRLCDDFIFTPFIVGQSVKLHPVVMLFAILAGVEVGGFLGLVFAVPTAAIVKVVLSIIVSNRQENLALGQNHVVS